MADEKYCRKCGAVNPPESQFCARCGSPFTAAAWVPRTKPQSKRDEFRVGPLTIPGIRIGPFAFTGKVVGIVALVVILMMGCIALAHNSSNNATPTPTVEATVAATPTAMPTVTTTPAKQTATLTSAQLDIYNNGFANDGYTITKPLAYESTFASGGTRYQGEMTKNGVAFSYFVDVFGTSQLAKTQFSNSITVLQAMGFSGSYQKPTYWQGEMIYHGSPTMGQTQLYADASPNIVVTMFVA